MKLPNLPPPNILRIIREDLEDPERLTKLYVHAVRRKYWPNNERALLEFFALAEQALADDKRGTPESLFAWQLINVHTRYISNASEVAAQRKLAKFDKIALIEEAEQPFPKPPKSPSGWKHLADLGEATEILTNEDIAYVPAIMTQVFFPQKPLPETENTFETQHGKASVLIQAGILVDPKEEDHIVYEKQQVPSGSKARIILPYIVSTAIRNQQQEIDMGHSLRKFMESVGMPISGQNAKEITAQVKNIAAAWIYFSYWGEKRISMRKEFIASTVDFWIDKDERQTTLWNPTMELGDNFYNLIQVTNMPFNMHHVVQLQRSPRRMDLYLFLCNRTPRIQPGKPAHIPLGALQRIFAPDIESTRLFKARLKEDLKAILKVYPRFRIEIKGDMMTLWKSPSPIPPKTILSTAKIIR